MAIINSDFNTFFPFSNKHFSTIYRTVFTNPKVKFERKRMETSDGDFLDLDCSFVNSKNAVIIIHGLEGSSNSKYVLSNTLFLNKNNFDVIVINLRGCSGSTNKKFKSYHSGETGDLHEVIRFIEKNHAYNNIALLGFSLGGNVVLKYAGEQQGAINTLVNKVIAISPPCDLKGASEVLAKKSNLIYMKRFLKTLLEKANKKALLYPEINIDIENINKSKNFADFDSLFTAPSFGFKDAEDYWAKASSKPFLSKIKVSTFLLTSIDDPFLSQTCIPITEAKNHNYLQLEITTKGGHLGFVPWFGSKNKNWLEKKIVKYLKE